MITFWTANKKDQATILSAAEVIAAFSRETGFNPATGANNKPCDTMTFLANWKNLGIGENKIITSAPIMTKSRQDIKQGIFLFGPCIIGLQMPKTARRQTGTWKFVGGAGSVAGSWNSSGQAGHAVAAVGYDKDALHVISWGTRISMDWEFYETYNDESYVVLSPDWLQPDGVSPAPSGKTRDKLMEIIVNLSI